jgi:hypothetical protein
MGGGISTTGGIATELTQKKEIAPEEVAAPDDIVPEVEEVTPEDAPEAEPEVDTDHKGTGLTKEEAEDIGATGETGKGKIVAQDQSTVDSVLR